MTGIEIFILVVLGAVVIGGAAYQYAKHKGTLQDTVQDAKDIEVQAQQVVNELYNKDLRPIVAKKAPKKEKVVEQVETTAEVVTPQPTPVQVEPVVEKVKESKPEFPIDKPKKKRRHYSKKK